MSDAVCRDLERLPECPQGHGQMVLRERRGMDAHMAWQGAWYDCPPGPAGASCRSAVLIASGEFLAWLGRAS